MGIAAHAASPGPAAAQPARLVVIVVDGTGGVIRGAQVILTEEATAPETEPRCGVTDDRGQITFALVTKHRYAVAVQAEGFASKTRRGVMIGTGVTRLIMELHLASLTEHVTVRPEPEQRAGDLGRIPFKRVLTADDLRLLPDDPQAFEEALRAIAGPGAVFRIDGFHGSRLPPKNAIAQIRIGLSDFSAEHHEYTGSIVDIDTKPGIERFSGSAAISGRATALNAPDFITGRRSPTSHVHVEATVQGPLVRDRASFFGALS